MPSVRPARPADAEAIARVYVETWRAAYVGLLPDRVLLDLSLERVLAANPGLAERPVLPAGTEVVLPGAPAAADTVPIVTLWD